MAVITDSSGITEEITVMGIPCITLRDTTRRCETVTIGTNEMVGSNPDNLKPYLDRLFASLLERGKRELFLPSGMEGRLNGLGSNKSPPPQKNWKKSKKKRGGTKKEK